jgi:hypothetical protein
MLFAKYCELWQQQHVLMGLWVSTGGWVGGVRAGGLLTVLRAVTPAEALGQETVPAVLKHVMEVGVMCAGLGFCAGMCSVYHLEPIST